MRYLFFLITFCCCITAHSQLLSGPIVQENRKLTTPSDFTIYGNYEGYMVFELAVNREGIVTGQRLLVEKCSFVSTPATVLAKNELKKLVFQPGTIYPAFHHVVVRVNFKKVASNPN